MHLVEVLGLRQITAPISKETAFGPLWGTGLGSLGQHLPLCYLTCNQFLLFAFCQVSLGLRMYLTRVFT